MTVKTHTETASEGVFQWEVNPRSRVVEELDRTRRQLAARRVRIPAAADVEDRRLRDLSGDIKLKPGELRIDFFGAEDLAAKLLELSKAMNNDWTPVPDGVLFGSSNAHVDIRKKLIEENRLDGVVSMPSGVFRPYAGVSTAVLLFTKGGTTEKIWKLCCRDAT